MTTPIKIKRSGTASSTPSSLDHGELAINYADDTLFWKDSANVIQSFVFQAYASATHKSQHATGGSDALTPSDIGAAPAASPTFSGVITVPAGTVGAPSVTISGDNNTGLAQLGGADTASVVCGGIEIVRATLSGASVANYLATSPTTLAAGTLSRPSLTSVNRNANAYRTYFHGYTSGQTSGIFLSGETPQIASVSVGCAWSGSSQFVATQTSGAAISFIDGDIAFRYGSGWTVGENVTPTDRLRIKSGGAVRFVPLSADPASGEAGDIYYNSTLQKLRIYNGERWVSLHGAAWDISTARYLQEFSVAAQETGPQSICFKPDGTKLYLLGSSGDDVNQYDLSVPWDISTAAYVQNFSVASEDNTPQGLFFRADGLKMFMAGSQTDAVYEYTLSTAWDISTASYASNSLSVALQETQPTGLFFKPDGTKLFTVGPISDYVDEYDLATAWDISTATLGHSHLVQGQETLPHDIFFSPDGLRFFLLGISGDGVDEYVLGEAWELSEITSNPTHAQFRSFASEDTAPLGMAFSPDGLNLYLVGSITDKIYQYRLS